MSGEALRSVFAEFGFAFEDTEKLSALEKKVDAIGARLKGMAGKVDEATEETTAAFEEHASAAGDAAKATEDAAKKSSDATKKAAKDTQEATKGADDAVKSLGDSIYRNLGERLAKRLETMSPKLHALAQKTGLVGAKMEQFGRLATRATLGVVAVLGVATAAAFAFARAFSADAEALRESADAARVTEVQLQQLSFAGARAGVSAETTAGALNTLGEGLRAIEARTGGPTNALWRLGVRARNANGTMRDTQDVLFDVADRFEKVHSPIHRARLAQELFGSSGRRMLDVLRGGSAALREARADFAALGGGVLPEASAEARRFELAQRRMGIALDSVRSVIAVSLLPPLTWLTNRAAELTGWWSRMTRGTQVVRVALTALAVAGAAAAGVLVVAWAPVLLPIAKAAVVLAGLVLIFDDLATFIQGGDSALGRFIDHLFGPGAARSTLEWLRATWEAIADAIERAKAALDAYTNDTPIDELNRRATARRQRNAAPQDTRTPEQREADARAYEEFTRRQNARRPGAPAPAAPPAVPTTPREVPRWAQALGLAGLAPGAVQAPRTTVRGSTRTVTDNRRTTNHFTITGATDPRGVATEVQRLLDERQRRQRDAEHPQDAED